MVEKESSKLKDIPYGHTVQYGWLKTRLSAIALTGVVTPHNPSCSEVRILVRRGEFTGVVTLDADWPVIDLGIRQKEINITNKPIVPGIDP